MLKAVLFSSLLFFSFNTFAQDKNNSKLPFEITADQLEIIRKNEQAIFTGNVEAVQGNMKLQSDEMMVFYKMADNKKDNKGNSVSKVESKGNVVLSTPKETAHSERGIFDVSNNIIRLIGKVVLTSGKNVVKGEQLVYNLTTGQSRLLSDEAPQGSKKNRVRGVFMPSS